MIYLDNASTTKIFDSVNQTICKINSDRYFNSSALYKPAIENAGLLNSAKEELAKNMGTTGDHIIFTSGATESNNMAINGFATGKKDAEYIFSAGEHPSVFNVANNLKMQNKIIKFISLSKNGQVEAEALKKALTPNTHFVSIMHVSNETGAINDIKTLAKIVHDYNPNIIFHCDGTQAFGKIAVDVKDLDIDAYTISGHKFHGPKGVGALYVKNITKIKPIILGGGQQGGFRSGTENLSGYVGMANASTIVVKNLDSNYNQISAFRDYIKQEVKANCTNFVINEAPENSPYVLSISFKDLRGEVLLHMLEEKGILIGIGSACSSKKQSNRVLESMGVAKNYVLGSIRISFSSFNTPEEIKIATNELITQYKILKQNISK